MCDECNDTGVINEYYVNKKLKQVASDWNYCSTCYPYSIGAFESPWTHDDEIVSNTEYYKYIEQGYKEIDY